MQRNNPQKPNDRLGRWIIVGNRVRISEYGTLNGEYIAIGIGEIVTYLRGDIGDVIPLQIPASAMEVIP